MNEHIMYSPQANDFSGFNKTDNYKCRCGKEFKTLEIAMTHTNVLDNTPNVRVFEALRNL